MANFNFQLSMGSPSIVYAALAKPLDAGSPFVLPAAMTPGLVESRSMTAWLKESAEVSVEYCCSGS